MQEVCYVPSRYHDEIASILAFLPARDLKEARLVCKEWNRFALNVCKYKWTYFPARHNSVNPMFLRGDLQHTDPRLFRQIKLNTSELPGKFLETFDFCFWIQSVSMTVNSMDILQSLVTGAQRGLLPNLGHLRLFPPASAFRVLNAPVLPSRLSFPKLCSLEIFKKSASIPSAAQVFLQAFINASPNLRSLESSEVFDLSSAKNLRSFTFMRKPPRYSYGIDGAQEMLCSLSSSLRDLSLTFIYSNLFVYGIACPVIRNLENLKLNITGIFSGPQEPVFIEELHESFPNLKKLSLPFSLKNADDMIPFILKKWFEKLEVFETIWDGKGDNEEWTAYLRGFLKRNENLKVLKLYMEMNRSWLDTEDCFRHAMSLEVPNLILRLGNECSLTLLLRFLVQVAIKGDDGSSEKTVLEIRNHKGEPYEEKDCDTQEGFDLLVPVGMNLKRKFATIRLKGFQVPSQLLKKVRDDIEHNNLAVEIYN